MQGDGLRRRCALKASAVAQKRFCCADLDLQRWPPLLFGPDYLV
jgi:hypothetical protein